MCMSVYDIVLQVCDVDDNMLQVCDVYVYDMVLQVCDDISRQEKNIAELKKAIRDKEDPMKVAQTRLYNRESRPGVELCRDEVQKK